MTLNLRPLPVLTIPDLPTSDELRQKGRSMSRIYLPELTDLNPSSVLYRMIDWLGAYYTEFSYQKHQDIINLPFLATSQNYTFLAVIARQVGYHPSPGSASEVYLTLKLKQASSFAIVIKREERWFRTKRQEGIKGIKFNMVDLAVTMPPGMAGTTVTFLARQGMPVLAEELGQANGLDFQSVVTQTKRVVADSERIYLKYPSGLIEVFSVTDNLARHDADDAVYERTWTQDGRMVALFGNGTYGKKPSNGTIYSDHWVIPDNEDGNVEAGTITSMVPDSVYLEVTNAEKATGWASPDNVDTIRFLAGRTARLTELCGNEDDTETQILKRFNDIKRAYTISGELGENSMGIRLIGENGSDVEHTRCLEIGQWVDERNVGGEEILAATAEYHDIPLSGIVYLKTGYSTAIGQAAVVASLADEFGPLAKDAAGEWMVSDGLVVERDRIKHAIMASGAVRKVNLTSPIGDVEIPSTKLPKIVNNLIYSIG